MTVSAVLDAAGRQRSPATMPGYHAGRPPRDKRNEQRAACAWLTAYEPPSEAL